MKNILLIVFSLLFCFACTQQSQNKDEKVPAVAGEIENSIENLEKGFVLASQDEIRLSLLNWPKTILPR